MSCQAVLVASVASLSCAWAKGCRSRPARLPFPVRRRSRRFVSLCLCGSAVCRSAAQPPPNLVHLRSSAASRPFSVCRSAAQPPLCVFVPLWFGRSPHAHNEKNHPGRCRAGLDTLTSYSVCAFSMPSRSCARSSPASRHRRRATASSPSCKENSLTLTLSTSRVPQMSDSCQQLFALRTRRHHQLHPPNPSPSCATMPHALSLTGGIQ